MCRKATKKSERFFSRLVVLSSGSRFAGSEIPLNVLRKDYPPDAARLMVTLIEHGLGSPMNDLDWDTRVNLFRDSSLWTHLSEVPR